MDILTHLAAQDKQRTAYRPIREIVRDWKQANQPKE